MAGDVGRVNVTLVKVLAVVIERVNPVQFCVTTPEFTS